MSNNNSKADFCFSKAITVMLKHSRLFLGSFAARYAEATLVCCSWQNKLRSSALALE